MKVKEFKTRKGEFILSESDEHYDCRFIGLLSRITEQQAIDIIDCYEWSDGFKIYHDYSTAKQSFNNLSALESLHSLIKSLGIHLYENPYEPYWRTSDYHFAIDNTFYNPYIFKKK